jgi:hypothetical protein
VRGWPGEHELVLEKLLEAAVEAVAKLVED